MPSRSVDSTILITGFGLRNLQSLQDALQHDEDKKMKELYMTKSKESCPSQTQTSLSHGSFSEYYGSMPQSEAMSQTEPSISSASRTSQKSSGLIKLEYLMGITTEGEGEGVQEDRVKPLDDILYDDDQRIVEELTGTTEAMKQAQKYLKSHKIFEFFQFLIANMLSNLPGMYTYTLII